MTRYQNPSLMSRCAKTAAAARTHAPALVFGRWVESDPRTVDPIGGPGD